MLPSLKIIISEVFEALSVLLRRIFVYLIWLGTQIFGPNFLEQDL